MKGSFYSVFYSSSIGFLLLLTLIGCFDTCGIGGNQTADNKGVEEKENSEKPNLATERNPQEIQLENAEQKTSAIEQKLMDAGLVNLQDVVPELLVELKYSTIDNFLNADVYGDLENAYLRPEAAQKLEKAQTILQKEYPEFSLLVYDAARPRSVQYLMWDTLKMPGKINYVADPRKGSIHNYGMAVDLTVATREGKALDMGTAFDFFGPLAQPQLEAQFLAEGKLSSEQLANRKILRNVMVRAGFYPIQYEWWHFNGDISDSVKANYEIIE